MRWLYSVFMTLLTPYLLFRLWWKSRKAPAYIERIAERFSWDTAEECAFDVWVHAVSLGEVIAATPLIEAMLKKNWSVLVTTMTPTGAGQVYNRFGDKVTHRYIPYDLYGAVHRFFQKIKPKVGIIMETELWPNLIAEATAAHIPLFLANARLSEHSFRGYSHFKFLFKPLLNQFSAILAQSTEDAFRFISLGVSADKVHSLGNMKFDVDIQDVGKHRVNELKQLWGPERVAVILASTHDDEESRILKQFHKMQAAIPGVILLIAPRHPERFQEVYRLAVQQGFNTGLRSNLDSLNSNTEVVILDSLGELLALYHISDYAFVGGSLVSVGGHNVLEPIAMGVPVFSGVYVHHFKAICRDLEEASAMVLVEDADRLIQAMIELHQEPELKQFMVGRATKVLQENKGSVLKHLNIISQRSVDLSLA
jgi:3-deoxy-D-manno-octulosonic-acid transferase